MTGGTINREMYSLFLSVAVQASCLSALDGVHSVSPKRYWTSQNTIVATVSAYERMTLLSSGESIPYYSTIIDNRCTNYTAILFYVLNPPECAGKYFRLEAIEPEPFSGYLPPSYYFGKLYYWTGIVSNDLVSFPIHSPGRMNVGKTCGDIYYSSIQDAAKALCDLKEQRIKLEEKTKAMSNQIEKVKSAKGLDVKNDRQFQQLKGRYIDLIMGSLPSNENKQKELKMQIEKLEHLEKDAAP